MEGIASVSIASSAASRLAITSWEKVGLVSGLAGTKAAAKSNLTDFSKPKIQT